MQAALQQLHIGAASPFPGWRKSKSLVCQELYYFSVIIECVQNLVPNEMTKYNGSVLIDWYIHQNPKIQHLWAFLLYSWIQMMVLMMSSFISFQIIQTENSEGESHGRKPSQADPIGKDNRKVRTPAFSKRRNTWRHVFRNGGVVPWRGFKPRGLGESLQEGSEAREIILGRIELESALTCRLVCKEWRETVNRYKKLWGKVNEVFSIAFD